MNGISLSLFHFKTLMMKSDKFFLLEVMKYDETKNLRVQPPIRIMPAVSSKCMLGRNRIIIS